MTSPENSERLPWYSDHSRLAEEALMGVAIFGGDGLDLIQDSLQIDDLAFGWHQSILDACQRIAARGATVAPHAVLAEMLSLGTASTIGEQPHLFLADLIERYGSAIGELLVNEYLPTVKRYARQRRLFHVAGEIIAECTQSKASPDLIAEAEEKIYAVADKDQKTGIVTLSDAIRDVLRDIDDRHTTAPAQLIKTGYERLDNILGGWQPGRLYMVAARPAVGKSAFALATAISASDDGHASLFFSLEMSANEIAQRALAIRAGVQLSAIQGRVPLTHGDAALLGEPCRVGLIQIDDDATMSVARIASATRRAIRRHKIAAVFIDYLQLLTPENPKDPRHLQVGQDTRKLKILARQCNVPVICLCQLNREVEARGEGRPRLSDLRESGEIEQNADAVMFLWKEPGIANTNDPTQSVAVTVAKQRNGPTGEVTLTYHRPFVRFEDGPPSVTGVVGW